jgi:protease-4
MEGPHPPKIPPSAVLNLTIDGDYPEHPNMLSGLGFGGGNGPLTMRQVVDALDRAGHDPRIKGMVAVAIDTMQDLSHVQELRDAVMRFRSNGKFAYIYSDSFGEAGEGISLYYLASAFDQIIMQPMGILSIAGIRLEMPYARGTLDKLGVTPQFFARKEYKSVFESATNTGMSPKSRENMESIVGDIAGMMAEGIGEGRHLDPETVRRYVDQALFTDKEALAAKLVDRLAYLDQLDSEMKKLASGDPDDDDALVDIEDYAPQTIGKDDKPQQRPHMGGPKAPKVALIYVEGTIMPDGQGEAGNLASSDEVSDTIMDSAYDDGVKAIVLRIDSPGGSPTAAEVIRRAVLRAKEKGKTVIVSMGNLAASGGYWIAADADYIFAAPETLTGSIGVAGGKFVVDGLWDKLGIKWDHVQWGDNAGLWSFNEPYTRAGEERMNAMMDAVYQGFIERVAGGRHMSIDAVDKIARGRVWTGRQAKENGLVDALGGLDAALDYTAQKLGAKDRHGLRIDVLPHPKTPFQKLAEMLSLDAGVGRFLKFQARLETLLRPFMDAMGGIYNPLTLR